MGLIKAKRIKKWTFYRDEKRIAEARRVLPDDQPLSARATAVLSEASVFFAFCCCLLCFFVFSATAGFCCGWSAVST